MVGKRHMSKLERKECLRLYGIGVTIDALANKYDRHRETITTLIRRNKAQRGHKFRTKTRQFKYFARTLNLDLR